MADNQIELFVRANGASVTPTSLTFSDEVGIWGLRSVLDKTSVTAPSTPMVSVGKGRYAHEWTSLTSETTPLEYEYTFKIVYDSTTYYNYYRVEDGARTTHYVSLPDTSYYTSEAEVCHMLGPAGVRAFTQDVDGPQVTYIWAEIFGMVEDLMNTYLHQHYNTSTLGSVRWVRRNATVLAANRLTARMGNPNLFQGMEDSVLTLLEDIRLGRQRIPGVTPKIFNGPAVRAPRIETLGRDDHLRVQKYKSTGPSYTDARYSIPAYWW